MNFRLATILSMLLLLAACAQTPAPATQDPVLSGPSAPALATGTASVKIFIPGHHHQ